MIHKIDSVYSLYPTAVTVSGTDASYTAFDKDGNVINISMDNVNADYLSKEYKNKREKKYPSIQEQLDMQYWDKKNGTTTWVDAIAKVKSDNPKP